MEEEEEEEEEEEDEEDEDEDEQQGEMNKEGKVEETSKSRKKNICW